jgi:hypothetical protein
MKEADWDDCLFNGSVRKVTIDNARANSLKETAEERIKIISEVNGKNCNFVFEDYYTSILELLQAKAFSQGYNISNHLCIGFYLRDILKRNDLFILFDDLRYKRNSLTYYGKRMDFETAKDSINKCKMLIKEIRSLKNG